MSRARGITVAALCALLVCSIGVYVHVKTRTPALLAQPCWSNKACFVSSILSTITKDGLDAGYRQLVETYTTEPAFRPLCNIYGFALGDAIYKQYPDFSGLKLTPLTVSCNYHLYQQYPQSLLLAAGDTAAAQKFCAKVRDELGRAVPGAEAECYRGVGRGLPFINKTLWGKPEEMAASAAAQCKALAPNSDDYKVCLSAVFNSIGRAEVDKTYTLSVRTNDPLLLCKEQTDPELRSRCFGNYKITAVSLVSLTDFSGSAKKLVQLYGANATSSVDTAVWTLGYYWAADHLVAGESYDAAVRSCAALSPVFARDCIEGMSVGLAKDGTPNSQDKEVIAFCQAARAGIPGLEDSHCPSLQTVGYIRGFYSPAHFEEACQAFKKELGYSCETDGPPPGYGY